MKEMGSGVRQALRLLLKRSKERICPRVSFLPFNLNSCSECKKAAPEGSGEAGGISVEALRSVSVFLFIAHDRPVEVLWGRAGSGPEGNSAGASCGRAPSGEDPLGCPAPVQLTLGWVYCTFFFLIYIFFSKRVNILYKREKGAKGCPFLGQGGLGVSFCPGKTGCPANKACLPFFR